MTSDLTERWAKVWTDHLSSVEAATGTPVDDWRVGGRRTKAQPDGETVDFWQAEGLRQVEEYLQWYERTGWRIATMPDGKPAIEWEAEVQFGDARIRLIVDSIYEISPDPSPEQMVIVDYKTGQRAQNPIQLGLYASAIEKVYGIRPKWGGYYMSRKGELDDLIDLTPWSIDYYEYQFGAMNAYIDTGWFPPSPGDHCSYCSFSQYCVATNGSKSSDYPLVNITKEMMK
jgi:hypothetical protein